MKLFTQLIKISVSYRTLCFCIIATFFNFFFWGNNVKAQVTQSITTSGTGNWIAPAGVTTVSVECWGGGGAGGGATGYPAAGGGGGGGSYSKNSSVSVIPGNTYSYFVGAGGAVSTTAVNPGGNTWFISSSTILAKGGNGGNSASSNSSTASGAAAVSSGNIGSVVYYGGAGGTGAASGVSSGGGGASASSVSNGNPGSGTSGGTSTSGGAGANGYSTTANGASPGTIGGGGSGGHAGTATDRSGGAGSTGKLLFTYTCITYNITSTTANNVCSGNPSTVNLTGNSSELPVGTYTVTYNLTGSNVLSNVTATMVVTTSGSGSFNVVNLNTAGNTTILISSIKSGSCISTISANRSAVIAVTAAPNPRIEFTQGGNDSVANITVCGLVGGGGQNDMDIASGNPGGSSVLQWQISDDNELSWSDAPGPTATASQYVLNPIYTSFENTSGTYLFRVVVTNGSCVGISNSILLNVTGSSNLLPGSIGSNQNICMSGDPALLTQLSAPSGGAGTYTYQWQSSLDEIDFSNISGAISSTYDPGVISQTKYYRRVTISNGCSDVSNNAKVLITSSVPSAPASISGYSTVCANSSGLNYSIAEISNVSSYNWTLPSGWSISSGSGTNSITVNSGSINQSGNISITATNICGIGAPRTQAISLTNGSTSAVLSGSSSVCSGSGANLQVAITGGASPYVVTYSNGSNNFTTSNYLSGSNISVSPTVSTNYNLVSVTSIGGCAGTGNQGTATIGLINNGTWMGTADENWSNASNWCGGIPDSSTNVNIPSGTLYSPKISTGSASVKNLIISAGALLTISNQTLNLCGTLTSISGINCTGGRLNLAARSAGAQSISGSMFYNNTIKNLRISNANGVSFSGTNDTMKISGLLDFGTSNATLNSNNKLTMLSNVSSTSSIGDMTLNGVYSGNRIIGSVTVERCIPNHPKSWRLFSVPTTGQTIKDAWMEGNGSLSNSTHPGYGTIITSNLAGATTTLGFDIYTPSGSTLKTFNATTGSWESVTSAYNTIANTKGYMILVRGDRSVTAFNQSPTTTILRTTGQLYTPIDNPPATISVQADKYESVGNPFASAIDFSKLNKSGGIQDVFYTWDPDLTTCQTSAYGLGGYQTIVRDGNGYMVIPGGGSYSNGNISIPSGQAFFVHATGTGGQISFPENCKTNDTTVVARSYSMTPKLKLNLSVISSGSTVLLDGVASQFDNDYTINVDESDILKIGNSTSENIGIMRDSKRLSLERMADIGTSDTVFYNLGSLRRQAYQFDFSAFNFTPGINSANLIDKYLSTVTAINLDSNTTVQFAVNNDAGSYAADRFYLILNKLSTLPLTAINILAERKTNEKVIVKWSSISETDVDHYEIQRSAEGNNFNSLAVISKNQINPQSLQYVFEDNLVGPKMTFYRIKAFGIDGAMKFSNIAKVGAVIVDENISIHPNPVLNKEINIFFKNVEPGDYIISVYSGNGSLIKKSAVHLQNINDQIFLKLNESTSPGQYQVKIKGPRSKTEVISTIIL